MKRFAFYLPQFHPDKMNSFFWGENFTDWETAQKAKPLFAGHNQPFLPSNELGYYDLRDINVINKQCKLARKYNINGFAFYNYIFDSNTTALEKPINLIRNNKSIDIEYFICWVNGNWTKSWIGDNSTVIYKQCYDYETLTKIIHNAFFHFSDERYYKINGYPVFYVHDPRVFDFLNFKSLFLKESSSIGIDKVFFAAPDVHINKQLISEFDFVLGYPPGDFNYFPLKLSRLYSYMFEKLPNKYLSKLFKYFSNLDYKDFADRYKNFVSIKIKDKKYIPTILSGWDNTPRYHMRGFTFNNFKPELFKDLNDSIIKMSHTTNAEFLMYKAWNEWAEGNVLEDSQNHGKEILASLV